MESNQYFVNRERPTPEKVTPIETYGRESGERSALQNKPLGGLWTTPVSTTWGWLDWCINEKYGLHEENDVWILEPDTDNIYTIDTKQDFQNLFDEYKWRPKRKSWREEPMVDFEAVFEHYDGIHLTRNGQRETRHSRPGLYGWDCECVLWDDWYFDDEPKRIGSVEPLS